VEDLNKIDVCKIGKIVENYKYFPNSFEIKKVIEK